MKFLTEDIKSAVVTFVAAAFVLGCGPRVEPDPGPEPEPVPEKIEVKSVSLNQTSIALETTDTFQLEATVNPLNADDPTVSWSSSDAAVASVSADGLVTALTAGSAKITAKAGAKSAVCKVTVTTKIYHVTEVLLDKTSLELTEGDAASLQATVNPSNATDPSLNWSVDDKTVLSITPEGNRLQIQALKPGSATIVVSSVDGGKMAMCKVKVNSSFISVESLSLDKTTLSLYEGAVAALAVTVNPSNATDPRVEWSVDKPELLSVAADGTKATLTALKAGTAVVTVKSLDGAKTVSCTVTVSEDPLANGSIDNGDVNYGDDDYGKFN
ncbi:MAG: Ig-like domain-containing protein [Bacteroidales bacterium]|nr:Ig-like domain-containing protein [Bacteroidales bacterium]